MKFSRYPIAILLVIQAACDSRSDLADAYGNFEAVEVVVSSETQGRILEFHAGEGDAIRQGEEVVLVDTTQLHLKRRQLESVMEGLPSKLRTLDAQVLAIRVEIANLQREKDRLDRLMEGGAATPKQLDDINGQIALLEARVRATETQKGSVYAERNTLEVQVDQVADQIRKSYVKSPMDGIVLTKYGEAGEITAPGQPLFKMAHLDELILRAYISGNQLSQVQLGSPVQVRFDHQGGTGETKGVVSWISPSAEFTPKIIQTREERVSLVYAIKVTVPNDGSLKIGMPGEVIF